MRHPLIRRIDKSITKTGDTNSSHTIRVSIASLSGSVDVLDLAFVYQKPLFTASGASTVLLLFMSISLIGDAHHSRLSREICFVSLSFIRSINFAKLNTLVIIMLTCTHSSLRTSSIFGSCSVEFIYTHFLFLNNSANYSNVVMYNSNGNLLYIS